MMTTLTWLSHGSWMIEIDGHRVLLDPFFTDNPATNAKPEQFEEISHVLVSHGHFDHIGDVETVIRCTGAELIGIFDLVQWFGRKHGVEPATGMNIGGTIHLPFASIKMTPAVHSAALPDGSDGGSPAGFLLTVGDKRIYFACDTALFSDMKLYAYAVDVAVLPIGDLFTMGIDDSIEAINLIRPKEVLPAHYNTWPPIAQDVDVWAKRVRAETEATPVVLEVGQSHQV